MTAAAFASKPGRLSREASDRLQSGAEVLEQDRHGIKVMRLTDVIMLKLFRVKRWWSSAILIPYSKRFCINADRLALRNVPTVQIIAWYRLPCAGLTAVHYHPLPGMTLRQLAADRGLGEAVMMQLGTFVAGLHQHGIYFRSLHLGNIVRTPAGALGLIDVADLKIQSSSLSAHKRLRNLRHLCRLPGDRSLMGAEGWHQFVSSYVDASSLPPVLSRNLFSRAMATYSNPAGRHPD